MKGSWWTTIEQMDADQRAFVRIGADGRHLLVGPPGCGKTNLLLMRARYIFGLGLKNVLFLTYTRALADFIRAGVASKKGLLEPEQIQTFSYWALKHIATYAPEKMSTLDRKASYETYRQQVMAALAVANTRIEGVNLYDAVLVDEVQDLHIDEIQALLRVSERVTVAGDAKQMVYESGGSIGMLETLGFHKTELRFHYRIGTAIADVADKALQPADPANRLRANCNYREDEQQSRARLTEFASRDEQFAAMHKSIARQLRSYPNEGIGVIVPRTFLLQELKAKFAAAEPLAGDVAFHDEDDEEHGFSSGKNVHVISLKSSKGAEFRAVHLYGLEELKYPQVRRELVFTAVTRAKTSLDGYFTGKVLSSVSSAFAEAPVAPLSPEDLI
ncbi:hypothetical protein GmRootV35_60850 [Variovorax sp. V35]